MSELDRSAVVRMVTAHGFNVEPAAVERLQSMPDPASTIESALAALPSDAIKLTLNDLPEENGNPLVSTGDQPENATTAAGSAGEISGDSHQELTISGDITGKSTGTGSYDDFVTLFRDRYTKLANMISGRVQHRSIRSLGDLRGGTELGIIGMVNDIRSTKNGHWLIELEDETGVFPALILKDREAADEIDDLLTDEVIGITGTLSDDGEILFADGIAFPDIPRTRTSGTADRPVEAALVSDIHVGSNEYLADAWHRFAEWLHSDEAARVEYLLIAGDMVEGVGVYPGQDADLAIVDVYEQYEAFSEELKAIPGDLEVIMIPGNHDAVRLAEPQPAFDEDIASLLDSHNVTITANPSTIEIEGVSFLMYHGASFDEVIAECPEPVSYEHPEEAMVRLLRKRHLAPRYGGGMRIAPEESDYLVIDPVPDVFHAGHVHTFGVTSYRGVRAVNTGCWQAQTDFQRRNNLEPDPAHAAIVSLDTLDLTVRKFI